MKLSLHTLIIIFLFANAIHAQEITGKVYDATGKKPLPGAAIQWLDDGLVSDSTGRFSFNINSFPVRLEISYLGYKTELITIKKPGYYTIAMEASEHHLNEVVVQANQFSQRLLNVPSSVSALTEKELAINDQVMIMPAINQVAGVYMESGHYNTNRLSIRGIGSRTPYSTNRVRVFYDNIPLTNGEGESTLEDIDLQAIQRLEIVKGPTSSIYGAGLGGAVRMYSPATGSSQSQVSIGYTNGSFGLSQINLNVKKGFKRGFLNVNVNDIQAEGYRDNGEYERKSVITNGGIFLKKATITALAGFIRLNSEIPSSINYDTYISSPSSAAVNWNEANGYESYDKFIAGLSSDIFISEDLTYHAGVFLTSRDAYEPRPFNILDEETLALGSRNYLEFRPLLNLKIQGGGEYFRDHYEWSTYENLYEDQPGEGSIQGARLSQTDEIRSYYNLFLQARWEITPKLNIEGGLNYNYTQYTLKDLYELDNIDQSGEYNFDPVFSPRLGITYRVRKDWNVYFSVSHGFNTPSVEETLTPEGLINPDIAAETGINYELGTKGHWFDGRLSGELSLYRIFIENLLVAERIGADQYVGINAGETIHDGAEITLDYFTKLGAEVEFNPFLNLTLTNYRFEEYINDGVNFEGKTISGFPSSMVNLGTSLSYKKLRFIFDYRYTGEVALNDENELYNDPYSLLNSKLSYEIGLGKGFNLTLNAGVNNIFDTNYASMVLVNAVGFGGAAPRYYYPGLPRNYYFGIRLGYDF